MKGKLSLLSSALFAQRVFLVLGLSLDDVTVPQYGRKGDEAALLCDFTLDADKLQSLKWYKDGHEFFRYTPQPHPQILTFTVDGVSVDTSKSHMNRVVIRNISLSSEGKYRCEVSADRPSFRTLSKEGELFLYAPPNGNPEIAGVHSNLNVGDTLTANCTCSPTKPAASLVFYINDEKLDDHLIEYPPTKEPDGLMSVVLGINIQLEPRHFKNEKLELKCSASIGNGYWVTIKMLTEPKINAQPSGHNQNHYSGGPGTLSQSKSILLTIFTLFIYHCYKYN